MFDKKTKTKKQNRLHAFLVQLALQDLKQIVFLPNTAGTAGSKNRLRCFLARILQGLKQIALLPNTASIALFPNTASIALFPSTHIASVSVLKKNNTLWHT